MPLLVVRHAQAGRRGAYKGDDRERPLTARGRARAAALVPLLSSYRPQRILSSPYVRCCETVQPVAEALGLGVESVDELGEGHGADAVRLMRTMAGESAVLCTHGDVATALVESLITEPEKADRTALRLQKGEVWVIQSTGTSLAIVDHIRRVRGRSAGADGIRLTGTLVGAMNDPCRFDPASVGAFRVTRRSFDDESRTVSLHYAFDEGPEFVEIDHLRDGARPAPAGVRRPGSTGHCSTCTSPPAPATTRSRRRRRSRSRGQR